MLQLIIGRVGCNRGLWGVIARPEEGVEAEHHLLATALIYKDYMKNRWKNLPKYVKSDNWTMKGKSIRIKC